MRLSLYFIENFRIQEGDFLCHEDHPLFYVVLYNKSEESFYVQSIGGSNTRNSLGKFLEGKKNLKLTKSFVNTR